MSGKKPEIHLSITRSIRSAGRKNRMTNHIAARAYLFLKCSLPDTVPFPKIDPFISKKIKHAPKLMARLLSYEKG